MATTPIFFAHAKQEECVAGEIRVSRPNCMGASASCSGTRGPGPSTSSASSATRKRGYQRLEGLHREETTCARHVAAVTSTTKGHDADGNYAPGTVVSKLGPRNTARLRQRHPILPPAPSIRVQQGGRGGRVLSPVNGDNGAGGTDHGDPQPTRTLSPRRRRPQPRARAIPMRMLRCRPSRAQLCVHVKAPPPRRPGSRIPRGSKRPSLLWPHRQRARLPPMLAPA